MTKIVETTTSIANTLKNAAVYTYELSSNVLRGTAKVIKQGAMLVYEHVIKPGVKFLVEITQKGIRILTRHKGIVATVVIVAGVAYVLYRVKTNQEEQLEKERKTYYEV